MTGTHDPCGLVDRAYATGRAMLVLAGRGRLCSLRCMEERGEGLLLGCAPRQAAERLQERVPEWARPRIQLGRYRWAW